MVLLLMILVGAILYALATVFISLAAGKADDYFVNVVIQAAAMTLPLLAYVALRVRGTAGINTKAGIVYGVLAGVSIAAFSVLLVKIFARGGNLAFVSPAIYGGAIIISSLIGWFVLHQAAQPLQIAGVIVVAVGIGLIVASKL